jgi:hypothetical protein
MALLNELQRNAALDTKIVNFLLAQPSKALARLKILGFKGSGSLSSGPLPAPVHNTTTLLTLDPISKQRPEELLRVLKHDNGHYVFQAQTLGPYGDLKNYSGYAGLKMLNIEHMIT